MSGVLPVQLGCCPEPASRCDLCVPATPPRLDVLEAWVASEPEPFRVAFFGGRPPLAEEVEALAGRPYGVRVRPDLLSRADARRLAHTGCTRIELDALTLNDSLTKAIGRQHRGALVQEIRAGVQSMGMEAGVVLAVGLPGSSHDDAVADARGCTDFDTARLHPVLVVRGSHLQRAHMDGSYEPLTLGQAVTTCRAMLEVFEAAGVEVVRIGQNPKADGLGWAVAGPRHSSLRELVEARRALELLTALAAEHPAGSHLVVACAPADEGRARGPNNQHVRTLRALGPFASVEVRPDPRQTRGSYGIRSFPEAPTSRGAGNDARPNP